MQQYRFLQGIIYHTEQYGGVFYLISCCFHKRSYRFLGLLVELHWTLAAFVKSGPEMPQHFCRMLDTFMVKCDWSVIIPLILHSSDWIVTQPFRKSDEWCKGSDSKSGERLVYILLISDLTLRNACALKNERYFLTACTCIMCTYMYWKPTTFMFNTFTTFIIFTKFRSSAFEKHPTNPHCLSTVH